MSLAFKKIKVYTNLTLFLIVAVAIGAVLIKNRSHYVRIWFFGLVDPETEVNVVWLMLWTAVGAVVSWWVLGFTVSLIKDARKLRRESEFQQRERVQQERAARLDEREKRIDQKVNQAIAQEPGSDEE